MTTIRPIVLLFAAALAGLGPLPLSAQGPREGITVHGHWVLEVRNPDGTVVTRREFDNALGLSGAYMLSNILARNFTVSEWNVRLAQYGGMSPWAAGVGYLLEEGSASAIGPNGPNQSSFKTLTVAYSDSPTTPEAEKKRAVVLKGSADAKRNGTVTDVETLIQVCSPSIAPNNAVNCITPIGNYGFTSTPVKNDAGQPQPLSLKEGQIVQVTVTISFTSP